MSSRRRGSTREIFPVEKGVIAFNYDKDTWSVFDVGPSKQPIDGIDQSRCACAVTSFETAHAHNVPTHFKRQATARIIHVKEFSIPGREPLSGKTHGRVLPVEWIWRARVFGSLWKRIEEGRVSPVSLGFEKETTVTKGMKLPSLMLECTTKFEEVDRHLSDEEAKDLAELTNEQFDEARQLVVQAVALTNARYEKAGFMCPDGKLELGMLDNGKPILVDVFGTPDENRIIDRKTGELYSKDLIRNYLDDTPWKKELEKAKARHPHGKGKWPAYPVLPHDFLYLVGMRYCAVAKRYAAAT